MKSPYEIVKRPIITEKSMELIEDNKYTFEVDKNANKAEIKKAIETIFEGVKVKKVRTLNFTGKKVRTRYGYGKKADWKKAYVTLTEDSEAIEYFDGM
ncbi:MAG: 50S ribosomal protein L23 [Anaerococcus hydrogenalis]|uniref:50S ribosomal protein L23 n=1 Tax=Anaerococcus TaxID=165779 RepID=UPI0002E3D0A1|nr:MULTISPECIES: 50S ribosomal protein L23 [Anaerococcus]MDU1316147.1 50S ribosomal protein L23 [Anaerococcus hydrogenalis]MDU2582866.1 50S ribosomal protein L23 [Anaerococcus hydrogenalis]MDU3152724.1 50S ribosomal protein L23 [Anaerococcus hydrogenalis]MDU3198745.1 50S ribosomal protein L23 [Anaerococcus hydrogenalis]MDU3688252.1 50S ribosomal protein L23 [Anaerococcus hydrogenalis]